MSRYDKERANWLDGVIKETSPTPRTKPCHPWGERKNRVVSKKKRVEKCSTRKLGVWYLNRDKNFVCLTRVNYFEGEGWEISKGG